MEKNTFAKIFCITILVMTTGGVVLCWSDWSKTAITEEQVVETTEDITIGYKPAPLTKPLGYAVIAYGLIGMITLFLYVSIHDP